MVTMVVTVVWWPCGGDYSVVTVVSMGMLVFVEKCICEFLGHGLLQRDEVRELGCRPTLSMRVLHPNLHHLLAYFHLRGNCRTVTTSSLGFSCIYTIIRCLYSPLQAQGPVYGREHFPIFLPRQLSESRIWIVF